MTFLTKYSPLFWLFISFNCVLARESPVPDLQLYYVVDNSEKYRFEDFNELYEKNKLGVRLNTLNLGFKATNVWLRTRVRNTEEQQILQIRNSHLDYLTIYFLSGNSIIDSIHSGDNVDFNNRSIPNNFFNFLIPRGASDICIKVKTESPMLLPIILMTMDHYYSHVQKYSLSMGIYFGFIIITFISYILVYIWLKELITLYYLGFLVTVGFVTFLDQGYFFQYLWPHNPQLNNIVTPYIYLLSFYSFFFTEKILNLEKNAPVISRIFKFLYISFFSIPVIFYFSSYRFAMEVLVAVTIFIPFISCALGIYFYSRFKNEFYSFLLCGWLIFIISALVYILINMDYFPYTMASGLSLQIGSAIQILFFNLAILGRINILKREEEKNILLRDQHIQLEKLVEKRTHDLVVINKDLDNFIYTAFHELRAPIANMKGLTVSLREISEQSPETNGDAAKMFDMVDESLLRLEDVVKNLTEISKVQKALESDITEVSISEIIEEMLVSLEKLIQESSPIIKLKVENFPTIKFSKANSRTIIYHLLKNAILYRDPYRKLVIEISYQIIDKFVVLKVIDNGTGIKKEFQGKIFGMFRRLHTNVEGAGMGLYIVKRIIENAGGKIEFESEENRGSQFKVFFPL